MNYIKKRKLRNKRPKQTRKEEQAPIIETQESSLPKYKVVKKDE